MRLYECHCDPVVKLRAARDDLHVVCLDCEAEFVKVEQEEDGE